MTSLVCLANRGKGFQKPHVQAKPFISPLTTATSTSPLLTRLFSAHIPAAQKPKLLPEFWGHPALGAKATSVHLKGGFFWNPCART